jgi:hypothetical protein
MQTYPHAEPSHRRLRMRLNTGFFLPKHTLCGCCVVRLILSLTLPSIEHFVFVMKAYSVLCEGLDFQILTPQTKRAPGWPRGRSSSPGMVKNILFSTSSRPALGPTQPPIQWVLGAVSPGLKQLGREADHSSPASGEVEKTWIYKSTIPYVIMA